ncbi:unnamed protein product [Effrenium voratum]|uniref:Uncharacterized protein n=1 Tax=Effrenium voratum TaxID=2562239 RepID=A0AA36IDU3_9DINO|nr:unnamed protein product [Effrenium voratum]
MPDRRAIRPIPHKKAVQWRAYDGLLAGLAELIQELRDYEDTMGNRQGPNAPVAAAEAYAFCKRKKQRTGPESAAVVGGDDEMSDNEVVVVEDDESAGSKKTADDPPMPVGKCTAKAADDNGCGDDLHWTWPDQPEVGLSQARLSASGTMPEHFSKWKLNKAEQKSVEEEEKRIYAERKTAGDSDEDAQKAASEAAAKSKALKESKMVKSQVKKSQPQSAAAAIDAPETAPQNNTQYYEALIDAVNVILQCPTFVDLQTTAAPLPINTKPGEDQSGVQAVFDPRECKAALTKEGCYRAAINLMWIDPFGSTTPTVPLSVERVRELGQFACPAGDAKHLTENFTVAVDSLDQDMLDSKGKWKAVSPEEMQHALLFTLADVIKNQAPDEKLAAWRRVFLSAPAVFKVVGGGDSLYWHSFHRRQQVVQTYDSLKRSARQLAFEVTAFKNKKESEAGERLGVKEVQDIFRSKALMAKSSVKGDMADGFVKDCLFVYEKLLVDTTCNEVLDKLESKYGSESPLNSLQKLRVLIEKAQWILKVICDMVEGGALERETITKTYLAGTPTAASLVELLKLKRTVAQHFLQVEMPRSQFDTQDLAKIHSKIMTICSYRKYVTAANLEGPSEVQWMSSLKRSSMLVLRLIEDILYTTTLNGPLIALLKKGKGANPLGLLEIETFCLRWKACVAAKDNELAAEKALYKAAEEEQDEQDECTKIAQGSVAPQPSKYPKGSAVAIYVSLRAEPPTQSAVARAVGDSGLNGDLRGVQGKSGVMIHFDANLFAEAAKRPDRRFPPLSPALMKKLIHGSIKGRGGLANKKVAEDHFDRPIDGDFIFLNDAGRNVLESLLAPFKSKDGKGALAHYLEHTEITLCLSPGKKKLNRGMINQIQRWHVISTEPMKEMYGDKMMGADSAEDPKENEEQQRDGDSYEPAFFNHLPVTLYSDALAAYEITGVLDCTPGAGDLAKAALLRRIPYMALTMTETHASLLQSELVKFVKQQMQTEGSTFYAPEWATAGKKDAEAEKGKKTPKRPTPAPGDPAPEPEPKKPKTTNKKTGKAEKKQKKEKPTGNAPPASQLIDDSESDSASAGKGAGKDKGAGKGAGKDKGAGKGAGKDKGAGKTAPYAAPTAEAARKNLAGFLRAHPNFVFSARPEPEGEAKQLYERLAEGSTGLYKQMMRHARTEETRTVVNTVILPRLANESHWIVDRNNRVEVDSYNSGVSRASGYTSRTYRRRQ